VLPVTRFFEENIHEGFRFCQSLLQRTTGSDRSEAVNADIASECVSWSERVGISMDGARALTGYKKDFTLNAISCSSRSIIHRDDLASRDLQPQLHTVLYEPVKSRQLSASSLFESSRP
jgi:hypothetical protein